MYDLRTLKPEIRVTEEHVECPVIGCSRFVDRQRQSFRRDELFRCPEHAIYISPSTFEYEHAHTNLLRMDDADLMLFEKLSLGKAEAGRLARERSEDALTFNVFRGLERTGTLDQVLSAIAVTTAHAAVPSYWSLVSETGQPHQLLQDARLAFEPNFRQCTEPDLLIETEDALFLVEAKLGAKNETTPTRKSVLPAYENAADGWYASVLRGSPRAVAVDEKLYQLMRCWLLGSWMAHKAGKRFVLVNLVASSSDGSVPARFGAHIIQSDHRQFVRATWEGIRDALWSSTSMLNDSRVVALIEYLDHKSLGYQSGVLQRAFATREGH